MNSIAVWWDKNEHVRVHFDVNIWHTTELKGNYLEFGLKLENYREIDKINIYIPYVVSKADIEDRGKILASDNTLTNAMFNERLDVSKGHGSFHTVKFPNNESKNFLYYELDIEKDIVINKDNTIILTVNKNGNHKDFNTIYYRFRINKVEKIFTELKENYFWIDGFFKTIGFVEVNVNSVRKLPKSIVDKLDDVKFDSMNLFIMTDNFTNFLFQSKEVKKSRILENHIWDKYLSEENNKKINKIIAYHWKKEDKDETSTNIPFEDYNLFVKISYIRKDWKSWLSMVVLVLLFGIISGVSGNYVTSKVLNNFNDMNTTRSVAEIDEMKHNKKGDTHEAK